MEAKLSVRTDVASWTHCRLQCGAANGVMKPWVSQAVSPTSTEHTTFTLTALVGKLYQTSGLQLALFLWVILELTYMSDRCLVKRFEYWKVVVGHDSGVVFTSMLCISEFNSQLDNMATYWCSYLLAKPSIAPGCGHCHWGTFNHLKTSAFNIP